MYLTEHRRSPRPDNDLSQVSNQIRDLPLSDDALQQRHVNVASRLPSTATDDPNVLGIDIEKGAEPRHPLLHQLPTMHQYERIALPRSDYVARETGSGRQDTGIVRQQSLRRLLLLLRQLAKELDSEFGASIAFILPVHANTMLIEQRQ